MGSELDCALDLMRRMPPSSIEDNLAGLIDLVPDLTEQLLSMVDQPLKVAHDSQARRDYLLCDYNRDGDSYRYPFFLLAFNYCVTEPRAFHPCGCQVKS
jgi:capping protein beta